MATITDVINGATAKSTFGNLTDVMADAMEKKLEKQRQALGEEVVELIEVAEDNLKSRVRTLRNIRAQEKAAKKDVTAYSRAVAYFGATGNPFPALALDREFMRIQNICLKLGIDVPAHNSDDLKVPDDFVAEGINEA